MNENKLICAGLRKEFSKVGWALLIYYGIMNASVFLVSMVLSFLVSFQAFGNPNLSAVELDSLFQKVFDDSNWGYTLAVLAGSIALLIWKKPKFFFKTIWKTEKPMGWGGFFALLAIFISGQALYQLLTPLLEWFFGLMGISLAESIESASANADSLSMFIYVCLLAPIWEEILFRGYVMRTLEAYGKKFAILASAFLFGVYHGNVVQSPYAFCVGLVLGYVAMEHSVVWAMVLHMINNLILGDTIGRLIQGLPDVAQEAIFMVLIWGCAVAAVVVLICNRKAVAAYFRKDKIHPLCLKSFFTSPGVLALTGILFGLTLLTLVLV